MKSVNHRTTTTETNPSSHLLPVGATPVQTTHPRFVKSGQIRSATRATVFSVLLLLAVSTDAPNASAGTIISAPRVLGLSRGLVGHWTFDGKDMGLSGTRAKDISGNNNHGTLTNGPTKQGGKIGQALEFGFNTAKYVDVSSPASLDNITVKTLCAWIYPRSYGTSGDDATIASKYISGWIFQLADDDGGQSLYYYQAFNANLTSGQWRAPTSAIRLNTWQHTCVSYDLSSSSNVPSMFINAQQQAISTILTPSGTADSDALSNLYIGNMQSNIASSFDGLIDDVRIYNRALSPAEISRLYRIGLGSTMNRTSTSSSWNKGLVGHWTFDGADISGTRAKDRSGNNFHGTLNGNISATVGMVGQALDFDGTADYVQVTDDVQMNLASAGKYTWTAWFKSDVMPNWSNVFAQSLSGTTGLFIYAPHTTADTNLPGGDITNGLSVYWVNNTGTNHLITEVENAFVIGRWYHIVITYNGSLAQASRFRIYIDGRDATGSSASVGTISDIDTGSNSTRIGNNQPFDEGFNGSIDDVRYYNRALSAGEIRNLYNETQSKFNVTNTDTLTKGLVGHWTFDGKDIGLSGTRAKDISGNNNHGTLTGGASLKGTEGKIGQGLQFDGIDDYVRLGDSAIFTFVEENSYTWSFWVKPDGFAEWSGLWSQCENTPACSTNLFIYAHTTADAASGPVTNGITAGVSNNPSGGDIIVHSTNNMLAIGRWKHVTVTYNGSLAAASRFVIYVDGVNVTNTADVFTEASSLDLNPVETTIGFSNYPGEPEFDGTIDEVRYYNRALSFGEINKLYQMGR